MGKSNGHVSPRHHHHHNGTTTTRTARSSNGTTSPTRRGGGGGNQDTPRKWFLRTQRLIIFGLMFQIVFILSSGIYFLEKDRRRHRKQQSSSSSSSHLLLDDLWSLEQRLVGCPAGGGATTSTAAAADDEKSNSTTTTNVTTTETIAKNGGSVSRLDAQDGKFFEMENDRDDDDDTAVSDEKLEDDDDDTQKQAEDDDKSSKNSWSQQQRLSPVLFGNMISSHPNTHANGSVAHDPTQLRKCLAFTAVPDELHKLAAVVSRTLHRYPPDQLDCIHLSIPRIPMRFDDDKTFPTTAELQQTFSDPRIILHRLMDYGPMTRYIGPLAFERHPQSKMVIFDMDSDKIWNRDLTWLFQASSELDPKAMWCYQGEDFLLVDGNQKVVPAWDTFPLVNENGYTYNQCHFCRGVGGMLFMPLHFKDFWYNQTDYHLSCFWDDDRWVSYQMDRQGFELKVLHQVPQTKAQEQQAQQNRAKGEAMRRQSALHQRAERMKEQQMELAMHHHPDQEVPPSFAGYQQHQQHEEPSYQLPDLHEQQDPRVFQHHQSAPTTLAQKHHQQQERQARLQRAEQERMQSLQRRRGQQQHRLSTSTSVQQHYQQQQHDRLLLQQAKAMGQNGGVYTRRGGSSGQQRHVSHGHHHRRLGTLTKVNNKLQSDQTCALAWMRQHPQAYPTARLEGYLELHPENGFKYGVRDVKAFLNRQYESQQQHMETQQQQQAAATNQYDDLERINELFTEDSIWRVNSNHKSCEQYFGNGYTERMPICAPQSDKKQASSMICHRNPSLHVPLCQAHNVLLDTTRLHVKANGGESVHDVKGRRESDEFVNYQPGAFAVTDCEFQRAEIGKLHFHLGDMMAHLQHVEKLECETIEKRPTLFLTRYEYANLYHIYTDWYAAFQSAILSLGDKHGGIDGALDAVDIVFMDGHSESAVDNGWKLLFPNATIRFVSQLEGKTCFSHAIFVPPGYCSSLSVSSAETCGYSWGDRKPDQTLCPSNAYAKAFAHRLVQEAQRLEPYKPEEPVELTETIPPVKEEQVEEGEGRQGEIKDEKSARKVKPQAVSRQVWNDTAAVQVFHLSHDSMTRNDTVFLHHVTNKYTNDGSTATSSATIHIVLISRQDYKAHPRLQGGISRKIHQELELIAAVTALSPDIVVTRVNFEGLSVAQQVQIIQQADIVVGVHGAGLSHFVVAKPSTVCVELSPSSHPNHVHFAFMSKIVGAHYIKSSKSFGALNRDFVDIPIRDFVALMKQALKKVEQIRRQQ